MEYNNKYYIECNKSVLKLLYVDNVLNECKEFNKEGYLGVLKREEERNIK